MLGANHQLSVSPLIARSQAYGNKCRLSRRELSLQSTSFQETFAKQESIDRRLIGPEARTQEEAGLLSDRSFRPTARRT